MLADDKLKEALFFLKKMNRSRKYSHFRYYLNAFSSAARSVTLVLQSDLRTKHGEAFERWYIVQQKKIACNQTARIVTLVRNVVLKEGSRLPIYTLKFQNPERSGECLEVKYDLGRMEHLLEMKYHVSRDEINIIVDETRPVEEQIEEQIQNKIPDVLERMEDLGGRMFSDIQPERYVSFNDDESPTLLAVWIKELEEYVTLLSEIVAEAKGTFKS